MAAMLRMVRIARLAVAPVSYDAFRVSPQLFKGYDVDYLGNFAFSGSVEDNSNPAYAQVRVFDAQSGILVRHTLTDPVTGAYRITNLKQLPDGYDVILYSPTFAGRAKVFRNVNPE